MEGIAVYRCPFCKCNKNMSSFNGIPNSKDLGCDECLDKTCHYCYGEAEYKLHLIEVHNIKEPKHIKIDDVDHTVNGI